MMNIADNPHLHKTDVSSRFFNHPMKNEINFLSREQLFNRRKYVDIAISFWVENKENAPKDRVDFNLDYFTTELNLINKKLK
jgi:hypothetical protein